MFPRVQLQRAAVEALREDAFPFGDTHSALVIAVGVSHRKNDAGHRGGHFAQPECALFRDRLGALGLRTREELRARIQQPPGAARALAAVIGVHALVRPRHARSERQQGRNDSEERARHASE